jgi:hypothetical protein
MARFPATVSATLCLATLILWIHSYRGCDVLASTDHPGDHFTLTSEFGILVFEIEWPRAAQARPGWSYFTNPLPRRYEHRTGTGFAVYTTSARHYLLLPPTPLWGLTIPHWFAFALTALLPAIAIARRSVLAKWIRTGRCAHCGYDLRATPRRCPECGTSALEKFVINTDGHG